MHTHRHFSGNEAERPARLRKELGRLRIAKDHAIAAYVGHMQVQRGLGGEDLQRAMGHTFEAQQTLEELCSKLGEVEREFAGL